MRIFTFILQVAAASVGLAQRALEEATKYAMERKTFGRPIAEHQSVAFMLADMTIGVETSRMAWMKAAWAADKELPNATMLASIAKCYGADVANKCATDAVQVMYNIIIYIKEFSVKLYTVSKRIEYISFLQFVIYDNFFIDFRWCGFQFRVSSREAYARCQNFSDI